MIDFTSKKKNIFVYDADIYIILKDWLELLHSDLSLKLSQILNETKKIHPELYNFLESRGFSKDWEKFLRTANQLSSLTTRERTGLMHSKLLS